MIETKNTKRKTIQFLTMEGRTMESDASDAIRYCQEHRFKELKIIFIPKQGWQVSQKYCCPDHQPKEILNPLTKGVKSTK